MALFESKPQTVEAFQWTGTNVEEVEAFAPGKVRTTAYTGSTSYSLDLLAGKDGAQEWVPVPAGHWLVHPPGDLSDVWPVDPLYFAAKYGPVNPCEFCGQPAPEGQVHPEWHDDGSPMACCDACLAGAAP